MAEGSLRQIFEEEGLNCGVPSSSSGESVSSADDSLVETIVCDQDGQLEVVLVKDLVSNMKVLY